jgi:hypothetical protein
MDNLYFNMDSSYLSKQVSVVNQLSQNLKLFDEDTANDYICFKHTVSRNNPCWLEARAMWRPTCVEI